MVKIALIQCPCSYGTETPSLGLAYLAAFLKEKKYTVSVLDLSIALYGQMSQENQEYWKSNKGYCWYLDENFYKLPFINEDFYSSCVNKILSLPSDILGFSIQNTSALFTFEIIKRIKQKLPLRKIILGGPNCYNISGDDLDFKLPCDLQKFADIIVIGEGEKTLAEVLKRLDLGMTLDNCKGIVISRNDKWIFNGPAEPIIDLDRLPLPDFDVYNLSAYTDKNALPVLTSRGCVMKCVFCTDTHFWIAYRYRKAENVVKEIIQLRKKYKNGFIGFNDSLTNGNYGNLSKLCDLLINKKVGIAWGGNCRVDKRMDLSFFKKMKMSGCEYLILGVESGSNRILGLMRKGFTIEDASKFIHDCTDVGIYVVVNWIVGFPGETEEDFLATVNFIEKHQGVIRKNTFSTLTINQFSYLEKHKEEFGIVLDGPHLGLWKSKDSQSTIDTRNARLQYLENIENKINRDYGIIRQKV